MPPDGLVLLGGRRTIHEPFNAPPNRKGGAPRNSRREPEVREGDRPVETSQADDRLAVGRGFVAALERQAWDELVAFLDPAVQFRTADPAWFTGCR